MSAKELIDHRQKLIKLADSSELGWRTVQEYQCNPLADDSDDERKMYKAEVRANRKLKAEKAKKSKPKRSTPYRRNDDRPSVTGTYKTKPGVCFQCGKTGHWKKECPGINTNNKMSIFKYLISNYKIHSPDKLEDKPICTHVGSTQENSSPGNINELLQSPVGKLKQKIEIWRSVAGNSYITDVINSGYKLPFVTLPSPTVLNNNKSARDNPTFVEKELRNLIQKGIVSEVKNKLTVVNPLTVAYNRDGKPRLVLDCRHINPHLHLFKVKFEDISVVQSTFQPGSYLFTFDLKSAYHHIDIFSDHRTYLGFQWQKEEDTAYYVYNSLLFGIATAGHIFTKVLRVVILHIRSNGHKVIMFLDDGIGGHNILSEASKSSSFIKHTLQDFGFILADDKCSWEPSRKVTWLGHVLDYDKNRVFITDSIISRLLKSINSTLSTIQLDKFNLLPVRILASIVGQIISLYTVLEHKVRIKTREMYNCILLRASWNSPVMITGKAIDELLFWKNKVVQLNNIGKSVTKNLPCDNTVFCDASGEGYGGYVRKNVQNHFLLENGTLIPPEVGITTQYQSFIDKLPEASSSFDEISEYHRQLPEVSKQSPEVDISNVRTNVKTGLKPIDLSIESNLTSNCQNINDYRVVGTWNSVETGHSSTWREIEAVHRVVRSSIEILKNSSVKIYSDNKNVKSILLNGSKKEPLHSISSSINDFCQFNNIKIYPEWIPREYNQLADHLSRCKDSDDWSISENQFNYLESLWGNHTVDRFSCSYNNHCKRFNSRWWVPQTEGVNAFDQFWGNENNWIVPPPRLISDCINKLEKENATCTLVVPMWKSAAFWPLFYENKEQFKHYITDFRILPKQGTIRIGRGNNGIFEQDPLPFNMIAFRINFN